jgi:hypothetical protein
MLRICRGSAHQFRPRLFPHPHGAYAHRSTVIQGRSRADTEWFLGTQVVGLDRHDCPDILHSKLVLHRLGQLLCHDRRVSFPAHWSHPAS